MFWLLFACSATDFEREQTLFRSHQKVASIDDVQQRYHALLELNQEFPESRAILEELLLFELEGTSQQIQTGLQRVQSHLQSHPGDSIFRIHLAKFYLQQENLKGAKQEIQLSLHNNVMHPWKLAQDDFFLRPQFREVLDTLLPLNGIQVLNLTSPQNVLVSQTAIWEIEVLHHASCQLSLPEQAVQSQLQIYQLQKITNSVDEWVRNTKIQIIWKAQRVGTLDINQVTLQCGVYSLEYPLPQVDVVSHESDSGVDVVHSPMFWYPEDVKTSKNGSILVREYFNDFQTYKGSIGIAPQ